MDGRGVMRRDIANLGPRASAAGLRRHVVNIEGVEERWRRRLLATVRLRQC